MRNLSFVGLPIMFLLPVLAMAQSDFDGTWKIDPNKMVPPDKPDIFLLQGGTYQCRTCVPIVNTKADGEDHRVAGSPYYDTISIKVLSDQGVESIEKQNGKTVATSKITVSPDGTTATLEFTDSSGTNSDPVIYKATLTRVGKAKRPAGAHSITGSWRTSKIDSVSGNALMLTFRVDGDNLNMTTAAGQSYRAKLDGTDAPYNGSSGINRVSVTRLSKGTIVETDKHDGKEVRVMRLMVDPADTKKLEMIVTDSLRGTSTLLVADKQ